MNPQPTPNMQELETKLAQVLDESRRELAWRETMQALLEDASLPIPNALPRRYRDVVLVARGQEDCPDCFASGLNLWNYQELEPCERCNGKGYLKAR